MTKKQAKARKAAWHQALVDGRVVRWSETSLQSYPTIAERDAALAKNAAGGFIGTIVVIAA